MSAVLDGPHGWGGAVEGAASVFAPRSTCSTITEMAATARWHTAAVRHGQAAAARGGRAERLDRCSQGEVVAAIPDPLRYGCLAEWCREVAVGEGAPTLGELIVQLRRELDAAQRDDPQNPIRFKVGPIELETALEVTRGAELGAGVVLRVLSLGGKRSRGDTETTRLKLMLTPTDRRHASGDLTVAAEDTEGDRSSVDGGDDAGD